MDTTTLVLAVAVIALAALAYWRGAELPRAGMLTAGRTLWTNLPVLLLSFTLAGLVQVTVPRDLISGWLGAEAGLRGVLVACAAGGLIPGPPYAIFPLAAGLYKAGAGAGSVVGFTTAWMLWSVSRLPVEIALVDPKIALVRYAVTFAVPPLAGLAAAAWARHG